MESDTDSSSSSSASPSSSCSPSPNPLISSLMVELPCKKEMVFIHDLHRHAYGFDYKACLRHLRYNRGFSQPSRHLSQSSRNLGGGQKLEMGKASGSKSGKF
ncbi:hypothetical protein MPTK2_3g17220 [Marchantia polymorpha subsp. ruderalis]